jgi:ABC-type antimicrobial peptide transport system permease subunit
MRAVLTTLGIIIGISAVIAMMEIGQGSSSAMQKSVASMGASSMMIWPGQAFSGGVSSGGGSAISLKPDDVEAIKRECPAVKAVAPIERERAMASFRGRNYYVQSLQGTTPEFLEVRDWTNLADGQNFTEADVRGARLVCVLGLTVAKELFGDESPVGQEIRLNNVSVKVVGVLSRKGANMMGSDQDDVVLAPYTTVETRIDVPESSGAGASAGRRRPGSSGAVNTLSEKYPAGKVQMYPGKTGQETANTPTPVRFSSVDQIVAAAVSAEQVPAAVEQITAVLRERHGLRPGAARRLHDPQHGRGRRHARRHRAADAQPAAGRRGDLARRRRGRHHEHHARVRHRTHPRDRPADGRRRARPRHSSCSSSSEAVILCLIGGAAGLTLGWGVSWLVSRLLGWPTESSPAAAVAAVAVSAGVGLVFGFYPAW